ncbi:MAG: glutamyl-tRNA reductase [Cocleimonas sp.]
MIRVIGINHKTASVDIREKIAFTPEGLTQTLENIRIDIDNASENDKSNEVIILSTCNRTEIYSFSDLNSEQITAWLPQHNGITHADIKKYSYEHQGDEATRHIMRVASGLDSMVLGEPQIFGQLKTALKTASEYKTAGSTLKRLMQHAFLTAKKVRTQTGIGSNPVSVAFAAVNLAKQIFSTLDTKTALLIGAGETIELVGKHLKKTNIGNVIIANRNVEKATRLAEEFNGVGISLQDIGEYLADADIVISSTAAPMPIIGKGTVEAALKKRKHKPIFMVDIAVPRDIEAEVGDLDDIYLYTVDDLQSVIEDNLKSRQDAAAQGELMINDEVENFMSWLRAQDQMDIIKRYRDKIGIIQSDTLEKAQRLFKNGSTAEEALQFLAHTLTNKLAHDATVAMNKAAHAGDSKLLEASNKLLNLSDNVPAKPQNSSSKTASNEASNKPIDSRINKENK